MVGSDPTRHDAPDLNPFAFPADTTFRFVLLIIVVIASSAFTYFGVPFLVPVQSGQTEESFFGCFRQTYGQIELKDLALGGNADPLGPVRACLEGLEEGIQTGVAGGLLVLLTLSLAIYWLLPYWKIWRERLRPLAASDAPAGA